MPKTHTYDIDLTWIGNLGSGTVDYRAYSRDHDVTAGDKPTINGSADPGFLGARERWNPEELLVVSLSQCHMLWYLGLAAREGIVVTAYEDHPTGTMVEERDGAGQFVNVTLRPEVTIADGQTREAAIRLHGAAHEKCFIARSVNFTVTHEATIKGHPGVTGDNQTPILPTLSEQRATATVDSYINAWNEARTTNRDQILAGVMTADAVYCDPVRQTDGRLALSHEIGKTLAQHPGRTIVRTSSVDVHNLVGRFNWQLILADGERGDESIDFVEFSRDGQIVRITGFFGRLRELT